MALSMTVVNFWLLNFKFPFFVNNINFHADKNFRIVFFLKCACQWVWVIWSLHKFNQFQFFCVDFQIKCDFECFHGYLIELCCVIFDVFGVDRKLYFLRRFFFGFFFFKNKLSEMKWKWWMKSESWNKSIGNKWNRFCFVSRVSMTSAFNGFLHVYMNFIIIFLFSISVVLAHIFSNQCPLGE